MNAEAAWAQLQLPDRAWLTQLAALAGTGARVALVGGGVRDALLGCTPQDLDVVLEGADVQSVAGRTGLPFTFHPAFQNATVTLSDGRHADLVRARQETYPLPGGNPVPHPGTLENDLRRRDFSLNALALPVTPRGPGPLLDVVGGLDDLHARVLRPLHGASFREDASRLVRGARLAARLGLSARAELLAQVPDALNMAAHTPRLWAELRLLLQEPRPGQAARTLTDWGAADLLPGLTWLEALDAVQDAGHAVSPTTYAAAALGSAPDPAAFAARLGLGEKPAALLTRVFSDTYFAPGTPEMTLRALLRPDAYVPLTGRDVVALGVVPGPGVGRALGHLAELRRAGKIRSRAEELAALEGYLEGIR